MPTLPEVRALAPDEEPPVDLYRFKNPLEVSPNRFDRAYQPPPTVKEVSENGGYISKGIYYGIAMIAKGMSHVTDAPAPIQSAIARPPPLDPVQLQRAASMCDADGRRCAGPTEPR